MITLAKNQGQIMTVAGTPDTSIIENDSEAINSQPLLLNVSGVTLNVTSEQYYRLNSDNQDLRLELTKTGQLFFKPLFFMSIALISPDLMMQVYEWNKQAGLGTAFGSSMGYDFLEIGGGIMNPDLSWVAQSRWKVSDQFCPVAPDFVLEYGPDQDRLALWQERMLEYQRLGVKLSLLVNLQSKQVEIYRPGQKAEVLESPASIDCNEVMPGFILSMSRIW
jgi:Uma2 family endonuclease